MEKFFEKITSGGTDFLIDLIVSLLILVVGFKIVGMLEKSFKKEHKFSKLDPSVKSFIVSFIIIGLKVLLCIMALTNLGVPSATIVTLFGSCALAVGLALQGGLSNLAGGLMILIFKPFKVGDYIKSNNYEGTVKSITMFYTCLISIDNKVLQLPNGNLSNSEITNYTMNKLRMLDINVSVSYDSDIKKVKKVLSDIANNYDLILKDKDIDVRLKEMADSSLIFIFRAWVNTKDYWIAYYDIIELIKETLDKNKIEIPYPQMDIHMKK